MRNEELYEIISHIDAKSLIVEKLEDIRRNIKKLEKLKLMILRYYHVAPINPKFFHIFNRDGRTQYEDIFIYATEDEWWVIEIYPNSYKLHSISKSTFYKADQWDGLMQFLENHSVI